MTSSIRNVFSVDVEDYFHVQSFADQIPKDDWSTFELRVCQNTKRILDLLDDVEAKATFFVLGWVAEREPELVKEIAEAGHEIGCHSYWHNQVHTQTRPEFREDLRRATAILEDIIGDKVISYRAPSFSVGPKTPWAFDELVDAGYCIDSSVFPIRHDRYGSPTAPRFPHRIECSSGEIWEFPPSTLRLLSNNLPVAGGGYFRLLPGWATRYSIRKINTSRQPFMFYIHPWEIDPEQPVIACRRRTRFRHYVGLRRSVRKLTALLKSFEFEPLKASWARTAAGKTSNCPAGVSLPA